MYQSPPSPRSSMSAPKRFQRAHTPSASNLRLPSLPKFHPASYAGSTETSTSTTPSSSLSSPGANYLPAHPSPMSPQRRQYSEAQRQLLQYQRELIAPRAPRSPGARSPRPASPHLQPLGSPGPVTPLELEDADSYLVAGAHSQLSEVAKDQIVDLYHQKEARLQ